MRNRIKLHPAIPEQNKKIIRKMSTDLGLDTILQDGTYTIEKVASKHGNCMPEYVLKDGKILVVGNNLGVAIFIENYKGDWFRTSRIESCTRHKDVIVIETMNSTYHLLGD